MGLEADAIQEVERLTKLGHRTEVVTVPGERSGVVFLVGPDGVAAPHTVGPAWHGETLATPTELQRFIKDNKGFSESAAVFYDEQRVTYVYDLGDRRDRASVALRPSPQFGWLITYGGKGMSQADFVRTLRINFRGCLPSDSNLLALVRNLKFTADQSGAVTIQHGRESIGKQINAAVTGEAAIPDELGLFIPIFENHDAKARVACAVEVLPHEQQFRLTPYPMELRTAMDSALASVADRLTGDDMPPVYRGQP